MEISQIGALIFILFVAYLMGAFDERVPVVKTEPEWLPDPQGRKSEEGLRRFIKAMNERYPYATEGNVAPSPYDKSKRYRCLGKDYTGQTMWKHEKPNPKYK